MIRATTTSSTRAPSTMAQQAKTDDDDDDAPLRKFVKFSRRHDEHVLALVKARAEGASLPAIAKRFKVGASTVQMATNAVARADAREAGLTPDQIARFYWRTTT